MKRQIRLKTAVWLMITAAAAAAAVALVAGGLFVHYKYGDLLRSAESFSAILQAADTIDSKFIGEVDRDALTEGAVEGMLGTLDDQWSYYVNKDEMQAHIEAATNSYVGIGVTVSKDEETGYLVVTEVAQGGSAALIGLQVGDAIVAAEGQDLIPLTLTEAKALIVGAEGTDVTLEVLRTDGTRQTFTLTRSTINVPSVTSRMLGDVGYVIIDNFDANTADAFKAQVQSLLEQGAQGLVLDVRFNGGGMLTELLPMLDYLLPEGVIFRTNPKECEEELSYSDAACLDIPMAVLVNDSSYSAAEFFAAALQEYGSAVVVGEHTTGKGYSQASYYLSDGTLLVLSTKEYRTPKGVSLAGVGIAPDIPVDLSDADYTALYYRQLDPQDDAQLQAALGALKK